MNQLATMSDLVLKGIEQAQQDLRKESDDALWQEGILRHVPIVGSLYNWISPIQKVCPPQKYRKMCKVLLN